MRRRTAWTVAASVAAHVLVLTVLALQRSTLPVPAESSGPPEPIIPVLLMPRTPPPPKGAGLKPQPIQLHRRAQRAPLDQPPIAPLIAPAAKTATPTPPPPGPVTVREPAAPPPPSDAVRATLRATLGCTEARLASLTREERQGCLDRLGRGAKDAPYLEPAIPAEKRAALQQAADAKMAQKTAAERAAPTARVGAPPPADYDGEPDTGGAGQSALGQLEHKPSKRAARTLPRLPP